MINNLSGWQAIASGQARLTSPDQGPMAMPCGSILIFTAAAVLWWPPSIFHDAPGKLYLLLRNQGGCPANIFDFKLMTSRTGMLAFSPGGIEFSVDRQILTIKNSRIEFAWGPLAADLRQVAVPSNM